METVNSFISNWEVYAGSIAAFVLLFDRIAKLTPTDSDNKIVQMLYKVTAFLGVKVEDNPGVKGGKEIKR